MSTMGWLLTACLAWLPSWPEEELTWETFERLHREVRPARDEAFRTIPWRIDLLDAQRRAAQESKPMFVWAMDGHPLGCT